jgi:hypothetical protein
MIYFFSFFLKKSAPFLAFQENYSQFPLPNEGVQIEIRIISTPPNSFVLSSYPDGINKNTYHKNENKIKTKKQGNPQKK